MKYFLTGYWRNLQQSQPNYIAIYYEKLTVRTILKKVAQKCTIPLTVARGMSSLDPKHKLVTRFRKSGKKKLILLAVADLDPAGDTIAEDLVKSLQRDFGLETWEVEAYKVALTIDQVRRFGLAPSMEAKPSSPTYKAFVRKYGITNAYELEAMRPQDLADELESAINKVMDIDLYNEEPAREEEEDSRQILAVRNQVLEYLSRQPPIEAVRSRIGYVWKCITLALKATSDEVLRILLSIGGAEINHFSLWHDKAV